MQEYASQNLYSLNGNYPTVLPNFITLSNGLVKSSNIVTEEELLEVGYTLAPKHRFVLEDEKISWVNMNWVIEKK
jgi:hypothetical protein